ncbi:MAG TPA: lysophospholipid acyltransferase family protein [Daejeonella sp.]|nr:lysophospholipid acyltransferase family protein [Daejeonella sp.]
MIPFKRFASAVFLLWCLLVFTIVMIGVLPFIVVVTAILNGKAGHNAAFLFLRIWGWIVAILCFFPVRSSNRNIYAKDKAYIFVSNHNSYLDSVAVVTAVPKPFKPLGKVEMNRIPIFGMIYRRLVIMIDRKSAESRKQCEADLRHQILQGQSVLIFPEGTMNRGEEPLASFYDGAFRLAIETQTPIAPMVILNARELFPRDQPLNIKPGFINCSFLAPVEVKGLTLADLPDLKTRVYELMKRSISGQELINI